MLSRRRLLLSLPFIASALASCGSRRRQPVYIEDLSLSAAAPVSSEVPDGPPPPKTEIQPLRPDGDVVWISGRWKWENDAWAWQSGRWVTKPYKNAIWVPGRWQKRSKGWVWVQGHWI